MPKTEEQLQKEKKLQKQIEEKKKQEQEEPTGKVTEEELELSTESGDDAIERFDDLEGSDDFNDFIDGELGKESKEEKQVTEEKDPLDETDTSEGDPDIDIEDSTEEPTKEQESEEENVEDKPEEKEEVVDKEVIAEEKEPSKEPDEQPPVELTHDEIISSMRKEISRLSTALLEGRKSVKSTPTKDEVPEFKEQMFIEGEEQLNTVLSDPVEMNKLLNQVFQKGAATGREMAMNDSPTSVRREVAEQVRLIERGKRFFKDNPELATVIPYVEETSAFLLSQLKDDDEYDEEAFYVKLADTCRTGLGISRTPVNGETKPTVIKKEQKTQRTPFAKPTTARKPPPAKLSGFDREFSELLYDEEKEAFGL